MLEVETRVNKISLPLELDPDFGSQYPNNVEGFVVTVRNTLDVYEFILLMPPIDDDVEMTSLVRDVMLSFLEPADKYDIRDLSDIDVALFEKFSLPVLCFHPDSTQSDKISFFWQIPPRDLMC
jgi:hypothetical protein